MQQPPGLPGKGQTHWPSPRRATAQASLSSGNRVLADMALGVCLPGLEMPAGQGRGQRGRCSPMLCRASLPPPSSCAALRIRCAWWWWGAGLTLVPVRFTRASQLCPAALLQLRAPQGKCLDASTRLPQALSFPQAEGWLCSVHGPGAGAKAAASAVASARRAEPFPPPEFSSKTPECLRILLSSLACKTL